MKKYEGHNKVIMVICDPSVKKNGPVNFQLTGKARQLATYNNAKVIGVFIGNADIEYMRQLNSHGAHKALYYKTGFIANYIDMSMIVRKIIEEYMPDLVMLPSTEICKGVAATASTSLGTGLIADCIDININKKYNYIFSRAALSSSVIANIVCTGGEVQMCTVKKNVFEVPIKDYEEEIDNIIFCNSNLDISHKLFIPFEKRTFEKCAVDLESANIIIGVGRGVDIKYIDKLELISKTYGAQLGCTRALVEVGCFPKTYQIGQSGKNVSPDLYIALGISGASQHIVGMKNAKKVIAVNRDENAPIFEHSDYTIVEDTSRIIDLLTNSIRRKD